MTKYSVTIIIIACLFLGICCKKEPCPTCPPPGHSTVELSLDNTECKEVWLKLKFTDSNNPRGFALLRDGQQVLSGSLAAGDTLLVDTTVVAGHNYTYVAQRLNGATVVDASAELAVRTLDSTSHNIQWQVDTLGAQGVIRDVWVFSKDNAWAVGEIYLNDSTGKPDMANPYNAARWDGSKWTLVKIPTEIFGGATGYYAPIYTIYSFGEGDIWTFSVAGSYSHWNGTTWTTQYVAERSGGGNKFWGPSSSNLFLVGTNGSISHYNGSSWTKMTSNTTVDLEDIYGLDANHIWIAGANANDGKSVILSFDGTQWNKIYDSNNVPVEEWYDYKSVWTDNSGVLYLASSGLPRKLNLNTMTFTTINTGQTYISYNTRGIKQNDFFVTGANNEVAHYNGSSWKLYQNIQGPNSIDVDWRSIKATKDFALVGGDYYFGWNSAPLVLRGYR